MPSSMSRVLLGPWPGSMVPIRMESARVPDPKGNPVVRRRELGALLRDLRLAAGMTVEQVAKRMMVSPSKVSRIETGNRSPSPRDMRDFFDLYDVRDQAQRDRLAALAKEARSRAWWQRYDLSYEEYVGLEADALWIRDFEPGVFPGLLQTPGYARALHEAVVPELDQAAIQQQLEVRAARQRLLARSEPPPPLLHAVMDEAVLHRAVGGPAVMSAQLDHVIEVCQLPNVTVQVILFEAGAHPALDSTFTLLGLAGLPGVVYVEGLVGHLTLNRPEVVARYAQVFDRLCAIALSEQGSIDTLARLSRAYQRASS